MKAFIVDRYQSADAVRAGEMPDPEVGDDDVLVQIHAASVNPIDSKVSHGEFKLVLPQKLPFVLGYDLAGVVVGVGSRVRRFKLGTRFSGKPIGGGSGLSRNSSPPTRTLWPTSRPRSRCKKRPLSPWSP